MGQNMTHQQRLEAAFSLKTPDRTPVLGGWIACPEHIMEITGTTEDEYWDDPIVQRFEDMHLTSMEALNDYANLYGFEYGRWVNLGIGDMTGADILAQVVNSVVSGEMTAAEAAASPDIAEGSADTRAKRARQEVR